MANSPAPDKIVMSLRIERELMVRLEKMAAARKEPPARTAIHLLDDATEHISLTPQEYEQIARETEEAAQRKKRGIRPSQAGRAKSENGETPQAGRNRKNEH